VRENFASLSIVITSIILLKYIICSDQKIHHYFYIIFLLSKLCELIIFIFLSLFLLLLLSMHVELFTIIVVILKYVTEFQMHMNCNQSQQKTCASHELEYSNNNKNNIRKIDSCDTLHLEMWVIYLALELTWRGGISK